MHQGYQQHSGENQTWLQASVASTAVGTSSHGSQEHCKTLQHHQPHEMLEVRTSPCQHAEAGLRESSSPGPLHLAAHACRAHAGVLYCLAVHERNAGSASCCVAALGHHTAAGVPARLHALLASLGRQLALGTHRLRGTPGISAACLCCPPKRCSAVLQSRMLPA